MQRRLLALTAAIALAAPLAFAAPAEAKSIKWSCVAPNPATPWIQVCYPSVGRP
jgi:ABC-type nitrate/sulfonate/bicarbonate transport system substrate-binding protein